LRIRHCVLAAALVLCVPDARADQTVQIGPGIAFSPPALAVAPGEKVTWVWMGGPHSTTSNATSGPEFWDSGIHLTGAAFSHTFTIPGIYPYYCQVHSSPTGTAMNGVIQVVAPTATPTPPPAATPPPPPGGSASIPEASAWSRILLALAILAVGLRLLANRNGS